MECFHLFSGCVRPSIISQSLRPHICSSTSRTLRYPNRRRKQFVASAPARPLSTSPPRSQQEKQSSSLPDRQPQSPQSSTATRPSPWAGVFPGQRPHDTNREPSRPDLAALQQKLDEKLNMLDFIGSSYGRSRVATPGTPYQDGITSRLSKSINTIDAQANLASLESVHLRLGPMLGRTVSVEPAAGLDLNAAFKVLESRCVLNRVRADSKRQLFHVRRGQQKKEMMITRWRALFKAGFMNEVGRVMKMKRQGW